MGALLGSPIPREATYATDVVVNFFDGGPRTKVVYRIGQRRPDRLSAVAGPRLARATGRGSDRSCVTQRQALSVTLTMNRHLRR